MMMPLFITAVPGRSAFGAENGFVQLQLCRFDFEGGLAVDELKGIDTNALLGELQGVYGNHPQL